MELVQLGNAYDVVYLDTVNILVVWLIIRLTRTGQSSVQKKESPLEVLKRRYASGEITTEEYEQRKKALEK